MGDVARFQRAKKVRRDVPPVTGIRQHADRFPVVAHQRTDHDPALVRRERHAVADRKRQQGGVRSQRVKDPQALDDAPVQVDPFGFGQMIEIDGHESASVRGCPEALVARASGGECADAHFGFIPTKVREAT